MKRMKIFQGITACLVVLALAVPFGVLPGERQVSAAEVSTRTFRQEELEQILAPIALYPDALLAQVLSAATYPLEVVEANRFVKNNPGLNGGALLTAAKDRDWEPSVKAMLEFPDVLAMMDKELEWTRKLGDAFIAQQEDCMAAVQRLRQRAHELGNLKTTTEQVIVVEAATRIIIIRPRHARIVYVPVYDPAIIYGVWWYPAYPPYRFYPYTYLRVGISFFPRIFVGLFWGAWDCNWQHRHVYVNIKHYNNFTKTYYHKRDYYWSYQARQSIQPWRYDSRHRYTSRERTTVTAQPSASAVREYKQFTVKAPVVIKQERLIPAGSASKQSTKVWTKIQEKPAPAEKGPVVAREYEAAEVKNSVKEEARGEVTTKEDKGRKVKEIPEGIGKKVREQVRSKQQDPGIRRSSDNAPQGFMNAWGR